MAFSQWTTAKESNVSTLNLSTSAPIEGTSSLFITQTVDQNNNAAVIGLTSGATTTTGKIRTLFRYDAANQLVFGVFGMMQTSIALATNAYWGAVKPDSSATTIYLGKTDAASGRIAGTPVTSAALGFTLAINTTYAIELKWQRDTDSGFVVLTVSAGQATDFSDLATKITYTDSSSPYSTARSAGIGVARSASATSGTSNIRIDKTQIFRT